MRIPLDLRKLIKQTKSGCGGEHLDERCVLIFDLVGRFSEAVQNVLTFFEQRIIAVFVVDPDLESEPSIHWMTQSA